MLFKLAWRNIWRNKRRTIITLVMVTFAVVLSSSLASMRTGTIQLQIENVVGNYIGYARVNAKGYWSDKIIDKALNVNDSVVTSLKSDKRIKSMAPRIEGGGLMYKDSTVIIHSKMVAVSAIDPDLEESTTALSSKVIKGEYLKNDNDILLGKDLAEKLNVKVGDAVLFSGMGYHGATARGRFRVCGLINLGSPEINKRMSFITLKQGYDCFAMDEMVTTFVVAFDRPTSAEATVGEMQGLLSDEYEFLSWDQLMPDLKGLMAMNDGANNLMSLVFYIVISFGVLGTLLMLMSERKKEFGVLVAIGMPKSSLILATYIELMIIGFIGVCIGVLLSYLPSYYFHYNPIELTGQIAEDSEKMGFQAMIRFSTDSFIFLKQGIFIGTIFTLLSLYPVVFLSRLNYTKAFRNG